MGLFHTFLYNDMLLIYHYAFDIPFTFTASECKKAQGVGMAGAPKRVEKGYFSRLSFLRRHHARSQASEKTAFWNLAVSDRFSRSSDFGRNRGCGVGTAGAPNQVCKVCTKSAKSVSGTLSAHYIISL
jgi:hypothetical protein